MRFLFVIHTVADPKTAVYKNYSRRKKFLEQSGHEATLLTHQYFPLLEKSGRWFKIFYPFAVAFWILTRKERYDRLIFHSYSGWVYCLVRIFFPGRKAVKIVTAFHGLEPLFLEELKKEYALSGRPVSLTFRFVNDFFFGRVIRLSCRLSDRVFCLNQNERQYLIDHHFQSPERILVKANYVQASFFMPHEYPQKARKLLFCGQWLITKGTRYLIEAFKQLAAEEPGLELHLAGTLSSSNEVLKDFPAELHSRITVYSKVQPEDMSEIYKNADIFIFPSLSEGFAFAIIEAMAAGVPIISTATGIAAEIIKDGETGLMIPKRDSAAIRSAVKRILHDSRIRTEFGSRCAETARRFEEGKIMTEWMHGLLEID